VDEISTVDKGAGVGTQIKFWKRDDVERFYRKIFGVPPTPGDALRDSLKKAAVNPRLQDLEDEEADDGDRAGDDGEEADDDTDETVAEKKHLVEVLAPLLIEGSNGAFTRQSALHYLMRTAHGAALVRRLQHQKRLMQKERQMPDSLSKIIADHGLINVAKSIAGGSTGGATEHTLSAAIMEHARKLYPAASPAQAFAKFYSADTDESLACRKAIQKLKGHPVAESRTAAGGTVSGGDAMSALTAKAEALRKASPELKLTAAQAFAKVYQDPANVELARAERQASRPVA
jgi:hypothetical protein